MRRWYTMAAAGLCAALALAGCVDTKSVVISMPALSAVPNGSYEGEYKLGPVTAQVRVTMADGKITGFDIIKHECLKGRPAEALAAQVVERQTIALDAVSGATVSSKAILKAGEIALRSAGH